MARGRKPSKATAAVQLLDALAFVRIAQPNPNTDVPYKQHCAMWNGWLLAFDGVTAAGHKIDLDIAACPHTVRLHSAIAQSTKTLNITRMENSSLFVKSEKFSAVVPSISFDDLTPIIPDPPVGPINDRIKTGFAMIGGLASDTAEYVLTSSVLLRANSMMTTDRKMMLEYWHGIELPTFVVPKSFVNAVGKVDKELVSYGYSQGSLTFYFADESWLKTQLYNEEWPDADRIMQTHWQPCKDLPKDLFEAIAAVAPFSDGDNVFLDGKTVSSHRDNKEHGATFECEVPISCLLGFSAKSLMFISKKVTALAFNPDNGKPTVSFVGDNFRGVLMGKETPQPSQMQATADTVGEPVGDDDNVPF